MPSETFKNTTKAAIGSSHVAVQKKKTTQKQRSIEPSDNMGYPTSGMIAIKEEKMDVHSLTQGRSQARLSALVEQCHEDSSMMQVDFGRLE